MIKRRSREINSLELGDKVGLQSRQAWLNCIAPRVVPLSLAKHLPENRGADCAEKKNERCAPSPSQMQQNQSGARSSEAAWTACLRQRLQRLQIRTASEPRDRHAHQHPSSHEAMGFGRRPGRSESFRPARSSGKRKRCAGAVGGAAQVGHPGAAHNAQIAFLAAERTCGTPCVVLGLEVVYCCVLHISEAGWKRQFATNAGFRGSTYLM